MQNPEDAQQAELIKATKELTETIQKSQKPNKSILWQATLVGAMRALGSVIALSVLIPLLVYVLKQFEWVPTIGDFIKRIIDHIHN